MLRNLVLVVSYAAALVLSTAASVAEEVTYWWPRPGSEKPLQICSVGYYKE
jgi:hypothetical protein